MPILIATRLQQIATAIHPATGVFFIGGKRNGTILFS